MSQIGMLFPVIAPISAHTSGSAITYGTGFVAGGAVSANLSITRNTSGFYSDDIKSDSDNSITGYTISFTPDVISDDARTTALGYSEVGTGDNKYFRATDATPPHVGFGYVRVTRKNRTTTYEAVWFHDVQFAITSVSDQTKQETITWNTTALEGTGCGVDIDGNGASFFDLKNFTSPSDAKSWLKTKANIA